MLNHEINQILKRISRKQRKQINCTWLGVVNHTLTHFTKKICIYLVLARGVFSSQYHQNRVPI